MCDIRRFLKKPIVMRKNLLFTIFILLSFWLFPLNKIQGQSFIWARNQSGVNNTYGNASAVDKNGNVYVTGHFFGATATFGNITIANSTNSFADFYIVKYDANGTVQWGRSAGGMNTESGTGICTDPQGNVIVCGYFLSPTINIGTTTLTNTAQYLADIFIVKYDPSGTVIWSQGMGGNADDKALTIAADSRGYAYLGGSFKSASIMFGNIAVNNVNAGYEDIFLAKFSPSGQITRANNYGGSSPESIASIAIDRKDNVYLGGSFSSFSIDFGSGSISSSGNYDVFVVKLDSQGTCLWTRNAGTSALDVGLGIAVDQSSNCFITGYFRGATISFGNITLTNSGTNTYDEFLVKYDSFGNVLWAKNASCSKDDIGYSLAVDAAGNVFQVGSYNSAPITFGTITQINRGSDDLFITKYDASGNVLSVKTSGGANNDDALSIAVYQNSDLFITGSYNSSSLALGNDTLSNSNTFQMFVTRLRSNTLGLPASVSNELCNIYPNPCNGIIHLTFNENSASQVQVFNMQGKLLNEFGTNNLTTFEMDLSSYPSGIYIISLFNNGLRECHRIEIL